MNNHHFRGIGTVFRYTVQQHYKTMSVKIFLVILFVLALISLPAAALMTGGNREVTETQIVRLYLRNETGFPIDTPDILASSVYAQLTVTPTELDDAALAEKLDSEQASAAAVITMDAEHMVFRIKTCYGRDGVVTSADASSLNRVLEDALHRSLLRSLSVTEAQEATVRSSAVSQVAKVGDYLRGAEETDTGTHVFANLFYCYFILILCALAMTYIFQLCMEEKVSKLVESLLVSVAPTALLIGKILAVTVFIFAGITIVGIGLVLSYFLVKQIASPDTLLETVKQVFMIDLSALHLSVGTVLLFAFCALLAYAIGASFSGIVGSCCAKTEDTQQASLAVMLFLMIGYFGGMFAPMIENDGVNIFCSLFPLTSMFTAFPNYVCGKIGLPVFAAGLVLQAAAAVLLARLAGSVYRMMLLYRGAVPKPKQLVQMLRETRAAEKSAGGKEDSHGA